jgi:hypothetical protein
MSEKMEFNPVYILFDWASKQGCSWKFCFWIRKKTTKLTRYSERGVISESMHTTAAF